MSNVLPRFFSGHSVYCTLLVGVVGITLWEMFTYGQRPYEDVRAMDIPTYLENGTRLAQPAVCSIDIYMIMIKCMLCFFIKQLFHGSMHSSLNSGMCDLLCVWSLCYLCGSH